MYNRSGTDELAAHLHGRLFIFTH